MPGTDFILIQANFSFPFLKTLLHGPARAKSPHHLLQRGASGGKDQHIGHLRRFSSLVQATSYQQPALPPADFWSDKFDACPRKETRSFAPCACTQFLPVFPCQTMCHLIHSSTRSLHLHVLFAGYCPTIGLSALLQ